MIDLRPSLLAPAHGLPVSGTERIARVLDDTASALEGLVRDTLEMMNAGARLDEIVHTVRVPQHLLDKPYLRPSYDEPEFVVRNIWRLYGGWHDGNPARLKPAADRIVAAEVAALAGGPVALGQRAAELCASGDLRLGLPTGRVGRPGRTGGYGSPWREGRGVPDPPRARAVIDGSGPIPRRIPLLRGRLSTRAAARLTTMRTELDPERLPLTLLELFRIKQGEMVSAMMHLGTRLGLWEALRETEPCTSAELAAATGLQERWLREWLHGMVSTDLVQHDDGRFALTPEARVALTDSDHWSYMPGVFGPPMTHREDRAHPGGLPDGAGNDLGRARRPRLPYAVRHVGSPPGELPGIAGVGRFRRGNRPAGAREALASSTWAAGPASRPGCWRRASPRPP